MAFKINKKWSNAFKELGEKLENLAENWKVKKKIGNSIAKKYNYRSFKLIDQIQQNEELMNQKINQKKIFKMKSKQTNERQFYKWLKVNQLFLWEKMK